MTERTISTDRPFEGRLINLRVDEVELDDGRRVRREVVEHPGAAAMLAWDGERLAMERQWRHAAGRELLEIPAGTIDPGEEALDTAARELREEVSLGAAHWEAGPRFFTAPGFCTEVIQLFLATELSDLPGVSEADEQIELVWLSLADALGAIDSGAVTDAKSIAGIYWIANRLAR
ncbi:MAG: NUDIX hydrolase [Chloroflexota bacterium]|nr:NUDIX hydrolase [Chloroflexota bacterium]